MGVQRIRWRRARMEDDGDAVRRTGRGIRRLHRVQSREPYRGWIAVGSTAERCPGFTRWFVHPVEIRGDVYGPWSLALDRSFRNRKRRLVDLDTPVAFAWTEG